MNIKSPFEIIKILGTKIYNDVPNVDKRRHAFIINRMLSRALPDVAINLSHQGIIPETSVDYWNVAFSELKSSNDNRARGILSYINKVLYVSMASKKKKKTTSKIDNDTKYHFIRLSKISKKEYEIILRFYEKDLIKYLKKFEKTLNTTSK